MKKGKNVLRKEIESRSALEFPGVSLKTNPSVTMELGGVMGT